MPTNDVVLLDSILEKSRGNYGKNLVQSDLFEVFCFDQILKNFDLSYEELEQGHVDGSDDGGIDGFYIMLDDQVLSESLDVSTIRRNPELEMIIITCKYGEKYQQPPVNSLSSSLVELLDLRRSANDILYPFTKKVMLIRETFRKAYINLAEKNPRLKIHIYYASRGDTKSIASNITTRARELENKLASLFSQVNVKFEFFGAAELLQVARKQRTYSLRIKFIENVISRVGANCVILTTLSDYYNFITDDDGQLRRYLFESNVRDYLGSNNSVIADIKTSLESPYTKDEADFWWFSNGITLLASSAVIVGKEISLENVQIVNGLQTSNAIHEYFSVIQTRVDDRAVLLKIIITNNEDIRGRIIKATNYQNAVDLASLRATDRIQRDIEEHLLSKNWYYDRRKNYYKNQGAPSERIITVSYLGGAIRALVLREPKDIENQTRWMKNEKEYTRTFNSRWNLDTYLKCLEICKSIDRDLLDEPKIRIPNIVAAHMKYIAGILFLAQELKNTNYSAQQLLEVRKVPEWDQTREIIGHIQACLAKMQKLSRKKRIIHADMLNPVSNEFAVFALEELERNNFKYLPFHVNDQAEYSSVQNKIKFNEKLRLASELEYQRDFKGSLSYLKACLEEPLSKHQRATINAHIGRILGRDDQHQQACNYYSAALKSGLKTSDLFAGYARALYKTNGNKKKIRDYFIEALEVDEANAHAHSWFSTYLKSEGDIEKAETHARRALNLMPNHPVFLYNYALILIDKNTKDDMLHAQKLIERAILINPDFKYPHDTLVIIKKKIHSMNME